MNIFEAINSQDIIFEMEYEKSPEVTNVDIKSLYDQNDSGNAEVLLYLVIIIMCLAYLVSYISGRG